MNSLYRRRPEKFIKTALPNPSKYFLQQGLQTIGNGEWRNALCPFHKDTRPSLRVHLDSGAFRCLACGAHGGDVLAFHRLRYNLGFKAAAQKLGAWGCYA
jgi:DNA primase